MITRQILIDSGMVDTRHRLSVTALFQLTQTMCDIGISALGFGTHDLAPRGLTLVVLRQKAVVERLPALNETITLTTYPGKESMGLYYRYIVATDAKGGLLFRYISVWSVLNKSSRQMTTPRQTGIRPPAEQLEGQLAGIEPIRPVALQPAEERQVRFSDTDFNGHLNNVRYIGYFLDVFGGKTFENKTLKNLRIQYSNEVREGQTVSLAAEQSGQIYRCRGTAEGNIAFTAEAEFGEG